MLAKFWRENFYDCSVYFIVAQNISFSRSISRAWFISVKRRSMFCSIPMWIPSCCSTPIRSREFWNIPLSIRAFPTETTESLSNLLAISAFSSSELARKNGIQRDWATFSHFPLWSPEIRQHSHPRFWSCFTFSATHPIKLPRTEIVPLRSSNSTFRLNTSLFVSNIMSTV